MEGHDRCDLMTRMARLERELLFVRRRLRDQQTSNGPAASFQAVRVRVGVGDYAVASVFLRQIIRYAATTVLELGDNAVKGVLTLPATSIPVIDLGERLGLGATTVDEHTLLLIAAVRDQWLALIVAGVSGAIELSATELHAVQVLDLEGLFPAAALEAIGLSLRPSKEAP